MNSIQDDYRRAAESFSLPASHEQLELEIRHIQGKNDPFMRHIPESRLQTRIRTVVHETFERLTAVQQIKSFFSIESLAQAALCVVQDNDKNVEKKDQFPQVIAELKESVIGQEVLLRILHAISSIFTAPEAEQPAFARQNSQEEVRRAAFIVSAQMCRKQLEEETAYCCDRVLSSILQ